MPANLIQADDLRAREHTCKYWGRGRDTASHLSKRLEFERSLKLKDGSAKEKQL